MRYSKQREAVYRAVCGTKCHPDAEWVYEHVRRTIPDISLGTVYRNLRVLADEKKLLTVETEQKTLRFDADLSPHMHFVCSSCGQVTDLALPSDLTQTLEARGYTVESEKTVLYGKCPTCAAETDAPIQSVTP